MAEKDCSGVGAGGEPDETESSGAGSGRPTTALGCCARVITFVVGVPVCLLKCVFVDMPRDIVQRILIQKETRALKRNRIAAHSAPGLAFELNDRVEALHTHHYGEIVRTNDNGKLHIDGWVVPSAFLVKFDIYPDDPIWMAGSELLYDRR